MEFVEDALAKEDDYTPMLVPRCTVARLKRKCSTYKHLAPMSGASAAGVVLLGVDPLWVVLACLFWTVMIDLLEDDGK